MSAKYWKRSDQIVTATGGPLAEREEGGADWLSVCVPAGTTAGPSLATATSVMSDAINVETADAKKHLSFPEVDTESELC